MNQGLNTRRFSSPFADYQDIGSPRADDHELLELPYMPEDPYLEAALQAPPSPDYVPGPEEPEHAPPSPDYVPGAEHADDEIVAKDHPYAKDASPIAQSPGFVQSMILRQTVRSCCFTVTPRLQEETERIEMMSLRGTPPPHHAHIVLTDRITIPEPLPIPAWSDSEVA
ncbi:hypothetical protein Tco_0685653 [Tanacetum coccineum]